LFWEYVVEKVDPEAFAATAAKLRRSISALGVAEQSVYVPQVAVAEVVSHWPLEPRAQAGSLAVEIVCTPKS
jgi:hypothetical protein